MHYSCLIDYRTLCIYGTVLDVTQKKLLLFRTYTLPLLWRQTFWVSHDFSDYVTCHQITVVSTKPLIQYLCIYTLTYSNPSDSPDWPWVVKKLVHDYMCWNNSKQNFRHPSSSAPETLLFFHLRKIDMLNVMWNGYQDISLKLSNMLLKFSG